MEQSKRNGYIDIIKFAFALIIMEFHQGTGIFPGGRVAVEGFFMISSYLMMCYIERNKHPEDNLGISTARFIGHKYGGLFPFLLPSVLISYILNCVARQSGIRAAFTKLPLLLFELIPLRDAGFSGHYVLGISWYISVMFIALAVLYPLCRKFGQTFTLIVCPLLAVLILGYLSHTYGHLAVASMYIEGVVINAGILRGLAACALGCVIYEVCRYLSTKKVTLRGKFIFAALEILGAALLLCMIHYRPKSAYDYVCVFLIFGLLIIGISGISATSVLWRGNWTKKFGTWSTLIVLNHCCYRDLLPTLFGRDYIRTNKVWLYHLGVILSCISVYWLSKLVKLVMHKMSFKNLFASQN